VWRKKLSVTCNICGDIRGFLVESVTIRDWSKFPSGSENLRESLVCE